MILDNIYQAASIIGTITFALSGVSVGVRKQMDLLGIFIVAFLTANGGGVLRDVLVGQTPGVLTDLTSVWIVLSVFIVGCLLHRFNWANIEERSLFILSDALGLVAFSLTGALVGIDNNLTIFGVIVLSFLTATGGGILRDMLCNEVPLVLSSDFYGSVAVLIAFALFMLHRYGLHNSETTMALFVAALVLRFIAFKLNWRLPKVRLNTGKPESNFNHYG